MTSDPSVTTTRRTWIALLAILGCHLALVIHCAVTKSIGFDEGKHLAAGLAYLKHGEMSIYNLSPPIVRIWCALPAYLSGADIPPAKRHRNQPAGIRTRYYFDAVLAGNLDSIHRYVLWGRFMIMPISLAIGIVVFAEARRLYGSVAALLACATWSFSPTVVAHGSSLGTDMPLTVTMLLAVVFWFRFLRGGAMKHAVLAAVAIALAHTVKFTALLLWPMLVLIAILMWPDVRRHRREVLAVFAMAVIVTFVAFNATYGFRLMGDPIGRFQFESTTMQRAQRLLPDWLPIPFHRDAVRGFDAQKFEAESQYVTGLFGKAYFGGSWLYYPWLSVTKLTIGGLALLVMGIISFAPKPAQRDEVPFIVLVICTVVGMTVLARINIGIRYLLPGFPAAIIVLARSAGMSKLRVITFVAVGALAVESVASSPRMHSFVNVAIRPWRWLVPDQDWGQSLIELRAWMRARDVDRVLLVGPGAMLPEPYGIQVFRDLDDGQIEYVAISRCMLDGVPNLSAHGFVFVRPWRKLRTMTPTADLGGIVVYDMSSIHRAAGGEAWFAVFEEWQDAVKDPKLAQIDGLKERLRGTD